MERKKEMKHDRNYYIKVTKFYPNPDATEKTYLESINRNREKWKWSCSKKFALKMSYWKCIKILCECLKYVELEENELLVRISIHRIGYPDNIAIRTVEI